ncbi:hypothetical protein JA1_003965 [Spathaspora sp. JA1]|nr:hypothetical protein JA1_003965 [Spathaspora sp. JA1]
MISSTYSILCLPDEIIYEVLGYLNQSNVLLVRLLNFRFYIVATKRLFNSVYVNNGDPLVISSDISTPFYLKYTVINGWDKFIKLLNMKEFALVNDIVLFTDYGISPYLINSLPRLYIENEYRKSMIQHEFYISKWLTITIMEYNYTIEKLTITGDETKVLPFLKRLKSLRILNGTSNMFNFNHQQLITIQDLALEFREQPNRITDIKSIFNLEAISSLELKFNLLHSTPSVYDLTILASQLTSIKQFAIISPNIRFDKIIHQIKPNSLQSFYLKILGNYYDCSNLQIFEILKYQQNSIVKIYYSCTRSNSRFRHYGLLEFDRIYKNPRNKGTSEAELVLNNGGFKKLKQIVLNENYFVINKYRDIVCLN